MRDKTMTAESAVSRIFEGASVMIGGFGNIGTPERIVDALVEHGARELTVISCDAGRSNGGAGSVYAGVGKLVKNGQVKKIVTSHTGLNPEVGTLMGTGTIEYELVPQGTLVERIRAGGAGLGGVLTPTGIGTIMENGKEIIEIGGKKYLLELPIHADFALIRGQISDRFGNTVYRGTMRNFNPLMASAADYVIVGTCEVVDIGELDFDHIVTPGIFVDAVVGGEQPWKA